ncbi:MAG: CcmD family protein, partial [Pirellulaceae bacterium]|nr:CcmD family protein [Pirellulaceae bacterium]
MATFAAAYLIVWLAVVLYVVWMASCQRALARSIESLRSQLEGPQGE